MPTSAIDTSIQRTVINGFTFPLGVSPLEELRPRSGYTADFEPADGGEGEGDWEEWPDRYLFDAFISADRLVSLCRTLVSLMPGRVYPILDILGNDAYREVDPYIAYEPVGLDRFLEAFRRHREWFLEDGLVGFGVMSEDPFLHIYVDEHKIVTVRVQSDHRERVERVLAAFDVPQIEELAGVDSVSHEHRCVLLAPEDRPDLLAAEEILEELIDAWRLDLNVDRESNTDDQGRELGLTGWRCIVRRWEGDLDEPPRYAEVFLTSPNLGDAEAMAFQAAMAPIPQESEPQPAPMGDALDELIEPPPDLTLILADRVTPQTYEQLLVEAGAPALAPAERPGVHALRWLVG